MKVATYTRISTDEERQPFSLEAQAERLKSYVQGQSGWRMGPAYTDQVSGKTLNRPGLKQALEDGRQGRYDLLLVFKVDRLARSTSGLMNVLEQLERAGIAFRSASEPFDTSTAAGRMMIQMLGVFAEFEREMIVERTKLGLARRASKGRWTGGVAPFGYRYDPDKELLISVGGEARVVGKIFERYAVRRWGAAKISNWLNEKATATRRGHRWTAKTVLDVLKNETYTGKLPFNGQVFEAAHESIVDDDLFRKAGDLLRERAEDYPRRAATGTPYLLTSLLRCSRCGHGFIGTSATGKNGRYRYYTCYCRQRKGITRCDQERIPADALEDEILKQTLEALADGTIFMEAAEKSLKAWTESHPERESELQRIDTAIAGKRKSIGKYLRAFERNELLSGSCGFRVRELEVDIASLEAEKASIEAEARTAPAPTVLSELGRLRDDIRKAVEGAEPEQVKALLALVIDEITVESRSHIQPYFVSPGVRMLEPSRRRTGIEPAHRFITGALDRGDGRSVDRADPGPDVCAGDRTGYWDVPDLISRATHRRC